MKRSQNYEDEDGGGCNHDGGGQSSEWSSIAEDGGCDEDEAGPESRKIKVNTKQCSSQTKRSGHTQEFEQMGIHGIFGLLVRVIFHIIHRHGDGKDCP